MPAAPATEISAAYARLTIRSGLLPTEELLMGVDVNLEDLLSTEYVDWRVLATMFHNIEAADSVSPTWAARLGGQFSANAHGSLGFAALSAPTLGHAVETLAEFYPARVTAVAIEQEQRDGYYVVKVLDRTNDDTFGQYLAELVLKVIESLLSAILGHPVSDNVVVGLIRDSLYAGEFSEVYDSRVVLNCDQYTISIPQSWWGLPSPLGDESMYWANIAKCRELIASREKHGSAGVIVRTALRNHFDKEIAGEGAYTAPPKLENVAQGMHLTTRTLIRRLKKEDLAFKDILEELRRDYARTLLGNARLTVADVGELLGYREPANFGRAFRRWFGVSPAKWRHR